MKTIRTTIFTVLHVQPAIGFNRRGKAPGLEDRIVLGEKMAGKPLGCHDPMN